MRRRWSGYRIICDVCGDLSAHFGVDISNVENISKVINDCWDRQRKEVTEVNHKGHNWRYISCVKGVTRQQFNKWVNEMDNYEK